jgi:hypothetical protein
VFFRLPSILAMMVSLLFLGGCGVLTGLPGHGGGKRFAVEQELVAAATRGAIRQIDLQALRGKKVNLFVNAIGDTGSGNLVGGRYSVVSQLRGDYIQSPPTIETSRFPRYSSTTSSSSSSQTRGDSDTTTSSSTSGTSTTSNEGGTPRPSTTSTLSDTSSISSTSSDSTTVTSGQSTTDSLLAMADRKTTKQKGGGGVGQLGVEYKGLGAYQNSEEITSNDLQYLTALLQTYLFLRGIYVVPPSEAEIDVYVTVDVFGTVRSRVEWFLANNEILKAKTSLEIMAVEHESGRMVLPPQTAGAEAEYNEQYILWAGPILIKQTLNKSLPLLSDFVNLGEIDESSALGGMAEKNLAIPYPFQHQMERKK